MRVAVVGLGLIGGTVARRLARSHDVVGYDEDPSTRELAAGAGLAVAGSVEEAATGADVAVVATPLGALASILIALSTTDCRTVTDVGSVKVPVLAAARAAGLGDRFVGGHPMAGTEHAGFAASDPTLLDGAAWVLCLDDDTDLTAWLRTAALVTEAGCRVVPCRGVDHDRVLAKVSGLPHLLAVTLAAVGGTGPLVTSLAAGSFRDGTRVAGSRPELVAALCDGNRMALAVELDRALRVLGEARDRLRGGRSVLPLAAEGHSARRSWAKPALTRAEDLDPATATFREDVLDLGAAGGVVDAVRADGTLRCRRPTESPLVSVQPPAGTPPP